MLFSNATNSLQVTVARRDAAHVTDDGFDNNSRDLITRFAEYALERRSIVEGNCDRILRDFGQYAGRIGQSERCDSRSGSDQQTVAMTMIAAFKFYDLRTSRVTAGNAERGHRRFGAARSEAQFFDRGKRVDDLLGQLNFKF